MLEIPPPLFHDLLVAFESETASKSASSFLETLPASTKEGLIAALRDPPSGIKPVSLLRALWSSPKLRTPLIRAVAELGCGSTREHLDDVLAVDRQLLDEVAFLLAGDARDHSKTLEQRLYTLSQRAVDICRRARLKPSSFDIPLLVSCARTAAIIASSAALEASSRIIWFMLLYMWSSVNQGRLSVLAVTAVLDGELKMTIPQHSMLQDVLDSYATSARCIDTCFIPIVRGALSYMATVFSTKQATRVAYTVLYLFHRTPSCIIPDLLVVLEVFAYDHPSTLRLLIRAISAIAHASTSHSVNVADRELFFEPVHLVILFALMNLNTSDQNRTLLQEVLKNCLTEDILFDSSQVPSSSASVVNTCDVWRRAALVACVQHPAMRTRCAVMLRFFESMMWGSPALREWAVFMLMEIFLNIPQSRESILRKIFLSLAEEDAIPCVTNGFCKLFEQLSSETRSSFSLAQCGSALNDALNTISFLPTAISSRIVPVLVSVAVSVPTLFDSVLMFLRKVCAYRDQGHQHVGCAGFVAVLGQKRVPDRATEETSRVLATLLGIAHPAVRSFLVLRLLRLVNEPDFSFCRVKVLSSRIAERFYLTDELDSQYKRPLRINEFFTLEDEQFVLRDPVPLLLYFCATTRQKCTLSNNVWQYYVSYLGDENRALVDACLTKDCEVSITSRVVLLCSLLQVVTLSHASDLSSFSDIGSNFVSVYGVSLILRDFLLSREGSNTVKRYDATWGLIIGDHGWNCCNGSLTAREKASGRSESLHSEVQDCNAIPIELIASAMKLIDTEQNNLLAQVVRSELLNMVRLELPRLKTSILSSGVQCRTWCDQFITSVKAAFIQTCPWFESIGVTSNEGGSPVKRTCDELPIEVQTLQNSRTTEVTISDTYLSCTNSMVPDPTACVNFIKKLNLCNEKAEKALHENRFCKLSDSARISVRESCLRILLAFFADSVITNEWHFILSLCEKCLHPTSRARSSRELVNKNSNQNTSIVVEEEECVSAIEALTKLFRTEFASSMSVGLTVAYLELMYFLLSRSSTNSTNLRVMKNAVSSTLMDTLREYSVQHVGLMRQMVKVLLKAFEEKEAINFGVRVLEWLGNHVALIDSKYSGIDTVKSVRVEMDEFDEDILEEAWRIEKGIDDDCDEPDAAREYRIEADGIRDKVDSKDGTNVDNRLERTSGMSFGENEGDDTCPPSSFSSHAVELDPIRSLCLNETADGAVVSICCVFTHFVDVLQGTCRQLRLRLRNKYVEVSQHMERIDQVVQGVSLFLHGDFVVGCVAGIFNDVEAGESGMTRRRPVIIHKRKRQRRLKWPTDMQKRVLSIFLTLIDVVSMQLRILSHDVDSIFCDDSSEVEKVSDKRHEKRTSQIAISCAKIIRLLFEENAITIMGGVQDDWSKQWSIEERLENEASVFVSRWEQRSKRKHDSEVGFGRGKGNVSGQDDSPNNLAARDIDTVAKLAHQICGGQFSVSKKRRNEWWSKLIASTGVQADESRDIDCEGSEVRAMGMNKKRRLRSRNGYIDQYMREDREQESYVDLENFVVAMDEELT